MGSRLASLDLILKSLIATEFINLEKKNWNAISKLIPGTTASQCAKRFDELVASSTALKISKLTKLTGPSLITPGLQDSDASSKSSNNSRPPSASRSRIQKEDKKKEPNEEKPTAELGPVMVIHVCDEAKNLKKDFFCPRDLLVKEMKYFAEYLSMDAQRWEEVDISVHCDVQIFDWLMKYAKRYLNQPEGVQERPKLEANNVVSILISSDFLKMDSLVQECIEFCHKQISAIVGTNCNMNCINDNLVSRIADLFTHTEADEIKDKKDKFKNKLFAKKLEKLFEGNSADSPGSASSLFRCSVCKRILNQSMKKRVKCLPSRMTIDRHGQLTYCHLQDTTFDVNEYLIDLKLQLKRWQEVYWRVWGTINCLPCSRCSEVFPLIEFGHCKYHPEAPRYDNESGIGSCVGVYPCCHQNTLRFDPTQQSRGCRVKDHIVYVSEITGFENGEETNKTQLQKLSDDLLAHRDIICIPYQRMSDNSDQELNIFDNEIFAVQGHHHGITIPTFVGEDSKTDLSKPQPRLQALTVEKDISFDYDDYGMGESDDEIGDEESLKGTVVKKVKAKKKSRVTIEPQAILVGAPEFQQTKKSTWDSQRSTRFNQDAQRQEDQRRMNEICTFLTKLRLNQEKTEKHSKKEYAGGLFSKIEAQWKAANLSQHKQNQNQQRPKMRLNSLRAGIF
ncbi:SANT and BTB domain regulator of class switch recombination isoform X2 [Patella vulgata]|uniref:SANT and BTB domain regulator of class switch recombination isoform X2 n=1 Tax=Patella vulgata TaxID=6465 RepID=UPI0024A8D798|nr:SANT and BTB domain regulator of class switch recombination isoform X2 [Patella vulgata]